MLSTGESVGGDSEALEARQTRQRRDVASLAFDVEVLGEAFVQPTTDRTVHFCLAGVPVVLACRVAAGACSAVALGEGSRS